MNKRVASLVILLLLVNMLALISKSPVTQGSQSHPGPYFTVEPQSLTFGPGPAVGQYFTVTVMLRNVTTANVPAGLAGVEFWLRWNSTLIQPVSFTDMLGQTGGVLPMPLLYSMTAGFYLADGFTRASSPPYSNATQYEVAAASTGGSWWGDGIAAQITFQIISQPPSLTNSTVNFIFTDLSDRNTGPVAVDFENGYVLFLPEEPFLTINPEQTTLGPDLAIGQTFNVNVTLNNVTSFTVPNGISGVEVVVVWNTSLIQPVALTDLVGTAGGVLNPPLLYNPSAGFYNSSDQQISGPPYTGAVKFHVAVASTSSPWWGKGTIATLTFKVIYQPTAFEPAVRCPITFSYVQLVDGIANTVDSVSFDGYCDILPHTAGLPLLYLSPDSVQVVHSISFSEQVRVANVTDLYAFDVTLHFDPSLLQAGNATEGTFLSSGGTTNVFVDEVNETQGYVRYVVTLLTAPTGVNGSGTLFTVPFTSDLVDKGTCSLSFGGTELSDSNVNLIPYDYAVGNVTVADLTTVTQNVTVNQTQYTVLLVSNSSVPTGSQFIVDPANKTMSVNVTGTSGYSGFCNVTVPKDVMNGTFAVLVNGTAVAYTLTENATHFMVYFTYNQSSEQVEVLLTLPGDINGDRRVSLQDLVLLAMAYGSKLGDPKWDARCDLKRDNKISLLDLVVLAKNYGKTYVPG